MQAIIHVYLRGEYRGIYLEFTDVTVRTVFMPRISIDHSASSYTIYWQSTGKVAPTDLNGFKVRAALQGIFAITNFSCRVEPYIIQKYE